MKIMKKIFIPFVLFIFLVSCAAKSGNQFLDKMSTEEINAKLIKGVTTKEEARSAFGDPSNATVGSDGSEYWVYSFARAAHKGINFVPYANMVYSGTNDDAKGLSISFDKNGIVESYVHTQSKGETKSGLFQ